MKKMIPMILFLCSLFLLLSLPSSALWLTESNKYSYREYRQWARKASLPEDFVSYDDIAFLGEFVEFSIPSENKDISSYGYRLKTEDGLDISISINGNADAYATFNKHVLSGQYIYEQPGFPDLRLVDTAVIKEREGHTQSCDDIFVITAKQVEYWYDTDGTLLFIRLYNGENWYELLTDFSRCESDSWIGKLLWYSTADEGAAEIKVRFSGFYKKPWEQPLTICLSAIGGAVVATLITFLVMCKKRGKLAPATAGAAPCRGDICGRC